MESNGQQENDENPFEDEPPTGSTRIVVLMKISG
jgi:hypothetical protein